MRCKKCKAKLNSPISRCRFCNQLLAAVSLPILLGISGALFLGVLILSTQKNLTEPNNTKIIFNSLNYVKTEHFGCVNKETIDKLSNLVIRGDRASFKDELDSQLINGNCIWLNKNEPLYVVKPEGKGLIKVRKPSEKIEYWTDELTITGTIE